MINPDLIIQEITEQSKIYFNNSILSFEKDRYHYKYFSTSNYPSEAICREETVKVAKWVEGFWIYIEIEFRRNENNNDYYIFFSLLVYRGESEDPIKIPLFRAEWDNYPDNNEHPQPHWHFYEKSGLEHSASSFLELIENEDNRGFAAILDEDNSQNVDMTKMHFAMNAAWENNNGHIHKANDTNTFIQWFVGLIGHIKHQLEYISE